MLILLTSFYLLHNSFIPTTQTAISSITQIILTCEILRNIYVFDPVCHSEDVLI